MKKFYFTLATFLFLVVANAQIVNIPDPVFKGMLLWASPTNEVASTQTPNSLGAVSTYNTIDLNNDGEIQVSEALAIKYLKIEYSSSLFSIEGINSFSNLQVIRSSGNLYNLASVELTGLQDLFFINFENGNLSTLNLNNLPSLSTLECDFNQLSILNLSSFTNLTALRCGNNQLTTLNVNGLTNLTSLKCSYNQLTNLDVSGLINLESLIFNFNNISEIDVSGINSLTYLSCRNNQLTELNLDVMPYLGSLVCDFNQIESLDLAGSNLLQSLRCSNNQLKTLFIKTNNNQWATLDFSNNPTIEYICADEEDINSIQTKINDNGYTSTCHVNTYCSFSPGGTYYNILGNSKTDSDNNGCEISDFSFPNLKLNILSNGVSRRLISDNSGSYTIFMSEGTHTVTPEFENPTYFTISPTSTTVTFPVTTSPFIQDFCIVPNGVHHDLEVVVIPLNTARSGFDANYKIKYKNKGNQTENTTINFNYNDAILDFVSSSVSPNSQATGTLSFNVGTIAPFQSGEILVTLNINSPTETPAVNSGDVLSYTATVNGLNTDETPDDNTFTLNQIVVNSFDPNDKTCLEGTTISTSSIGNYVHYKIRFENTGTFAAQNIVVKDMINTSKFDVVTLQMTDASHSCVTRITNPNKVEFIFENINLPFDDETNDGYVVFKIKTKSTLAANSTISNSANIYFDYNFPIVTNTATSTFQTLQNNTFELDNYISLSPNPAKNVLNIDFQNLENIKSVEIYNMLGQLVQIIISPSNSINVSDLKTGNYIIKLNTTTSEITRKFIKE